MTQKTPEQILEEILNSTQPPAPAPAVSPHARFAAIVGALGVYEQVLYYGVCRVRSRGSSKTVPISQAMGEYYLLLEEHHLSRPRTSTFWGTLASLELAGFVRVHRRSNRIKITGWEIPFEDVLAHLSRVDFAAELARRTATT